MGLWSYHGSANSLLHTFPKFFRHRVAFELVSIRGLHPDGANSIAFDGLDSVFQRAYCFISYPCQWSTVDGRGISPRIPNCSHLSRISKWLKSHDWVHGRLQRCRFARPVRDSAHSGSLKIELIRSGVRYLSHAVPPFLTHRSISDELSGASPEELTPGLAPLAESDPLCPQATHAQIAHEMTINRKGNRDIGLPLSCVAMALLWSMSGDRKGSSPSIESLRLVDDPGMKRGPQRLLESRRTPRQKVRLGSGNSGGKTRTSVPRASALATTEYCARAKPCASIAASTAAAGKEKTKSRCNTSTPTPALANQSFQLAGARYSLPQSTQRSGHLNRSRGFDRGPARASSAGTRNDDQPIGKQMGETAVERGADFRN